jgi:DNA gyrase/topoisomerase IV subunit A
MATKKKSKPIESEVSANVTVSLDAEEKTKLENKIKELEEKINSLEEELQNEKNIYSNLESLNTELTEQLDQARLTLADTIFDKECLKAENETLKAELARLQTAKQVSWPNSVQPKQTFQSNQPSQPTPAAGSKLSQNNTRSNGNTYVKYTNNGYSNW